MAESAAQEGAGQVGALAIAAGQRLIAADPQAGEDGVGERIRYNVTPGRRMGADDAWAPGRHDRPGRRQSEEEVVVATAGAQAVVGPSAVASKVHFLLLHGGQLCCIPRSPSHLQHVVPACPGPAACLLPMCPCLGLPLSPATASGWPHQQGQEAELSHCSTCSFGVCSARTLPLRPGHSRPRSRLPALCNPCSSVGAQLEGSCRGEAKALVPSAWGD